MREGIRALAHNVLFLAVGYEDGVENGCVYMSSCSTNQFVLFIPGCRPSAKEIVDSGAQMHYYRRI
jgi:hypothetical protein